MTDTSPLSARDLKEILEQIAVPGGLTNHPFLHSWIIADYLHEHRDAAQFSAEFLSGKALEWELELWSLEYPLNEAYRDEWLKIFCLKWYYFQKKPRLAAFQKHQTLKKLGAAIVDAEVLAALVPGKETEAEKLLVAEEYRVFWYSFSTREDALDPNRASEKLSAALQAFADQIETRRAHKFAQPAQLPIADQVVASGQPAPIDLLAAGTIAPSPFLSVSNQSPSALESYQRILDQQYPTLTGYRLPTYRYTARGTSQDIKSDTDVQQLLENPTVLLSGVTGIGKTTYLTQVIMPACCELGLTPLFIVLPEYYSARDKIGDLPTFLREKVFGQMHPDAEQKDQFTRELAAAIFQRSVIWLLDGFDELTPRERGLLIHELGRLNHFVLTTRQVEPEASRSFEATGQLLPIDYRDALEYISAGYSPRVRQRIEKWCERQYEARDVLTAGWWLEQTAELAADPTQVLNLSAILDRAISRRLSTRARFQHTGSTDYYALTRAALRSLAFESLGFHRVNAEDPQRLTLNQLTYAWRRRSPEPEAIFLEMIGSTGLLLQESEHWRFGAELVRDELAAEYMESEGFVLPDQVLYPQVEQPIGFWAARLMRANQIQRVVDLLTALRELKDDPYGARWSVMVRVLTECLPFGDDRLREVQRETEQALLEWWHATTSNKMRWQINLWLLALGSNQIPEMRSGMLETAVRDLDSLRPKSTLPELLHLAGYAELAHHVAESGRIDQQAVTQALIDIIADGPVGLVNDAAIHLAPRNLEQTALQRLSKDSPIDRVAELARTRPMNQFVTPQDFKRAQVAQSAALGILGRPIVLAHEMLLKRIPADVIHSLMADLHIRIRKIDKRVVVITADGRDWMLKSGEFGG
jgi:hypothetical protein